MKPTEGYGYLSKVADFEFGVENNKIGYISGGYEALNQGPSSFFVRDETIFVLDNVNKKVLIRTLDDNGTHSFDYENACWLKDICYP